MTSETPRYAPGRAFPRYAHRPGRTPHPRNDVDGHSYDAPEATEMCRSRPWRAI